MKISGRMTGIGALEGEFLATGEQAIGFVLETAEGRQITVKGLTPIEIRSLAPAWCEDCTLALAFVASETEAGS